MAEVVYLIAAALSALCAAMLLRGYLRSRYKLLLWSSLCFVGLSVNNVILFLDLVVIGPRVDLSLPRSLSALVGLGLLIYALVWEAS